MTTEPTQITQAQEENNLSSEKRSASSARIDELISYILDGEFELFHDQFRQPCVVDLRYPFIARQLKTKGLSPLLAKLYWDKHKKPVSSDAIKTAITTLQGIATYDGEQRSVFNRIAKISGTIYYDIGDDIHVVVIDSTGWRIETQAPVLFRRYTHQKVQTLPVITQDSLRHLLRKNFNVQSLEQEILLMSYLPICFFPEISKPLLLLHGPQGSGKSTALELIRSLLDPSITPLLSPPKGINDFVQQADHNYTYFLDNLSYIPVWMSDAFCRLVTGGAFSKRELYSDDDDILYELKRVTGFNGISQVANKPDLLDRSLIIRLTRIQETARYREAELRRLFDEEKPRYLGALFSLISHILAVAPQLSVQNRARLSDYYHYASVASELIGYPKGAFYEAFEHNILAQNQEALSTSPVGQTVIEFMKDKETWSGSSANLYSFLLRIAEQLNIDHQFPQEANWLWRKIEEAEVTLTAFGIISSRSRENGIRMITLRNLNVEQNADPVGQADNRTNNSEQTEVSEEVI